MMEDNNKNSSNQSTQYIRSGNRGNTFDNMERNSKKEDALNPDYTNQPLGNKGQESAFNAEDKGKSNEQQLASDA